MIGPGVIWPRAIPVHERSDGEQAEVVHDLLLDQRDHGVAPAEATDPIPEKTPGRPAQ